MARVRRSLGNNNIVIVCEGTDTEISYLKEIVLYTQAHSPERFCDIKIVPTEDDIELREQLIREGRKHRTLKGDMQWSYYVKKETNQQDYDHYKAQPIRYVREAYLFMQEDGYQEAWAVFDNDNFPAHGQAFQYADSIQGLNIAYSSISIEEWFLLHFERNENAFLKSVCKERKKDIFCGTGAHPNDCHGTLCVGGRLREAGHIKNYAKSNTGLFERYTLPLLSTLLFNCAWVRSLSSDPVYERNPYTDFDLLLSRLIGQDNHFRWHVNEIHTKDMTIRTNKVNGKIYINFSGSHPILKHTISVVSTDLVNVFTNQSVISSGATISLNEIDGFLIYEENTFFNVLKL